MRRGVGGWGQVQVPPCPQGTASPGGREFRGLAPEEGKMGFPCNVPGAKVGRVHWVAVSSV